MIGHEVFVTGFLATASLMRYVTLRRKLPYSFENSRVLYRAILWAAHDEENLHRWFSSNYNVEVHAYVKNGKYCIVNNTYEPQDTTVYKGDGTSFDLHMEANEIIWKEI